jgi:hypothetical protein
MRRDLYELNPSLTKGERLWRAMLITAAIAVTLMDLFFWRP